MRPSCWRPYARTASGYYYNAPARYYRYETEADFETAKALLRQFSQEVLRHHEGDGLSVWNWKGDQGMSWIYERE